MSDNKVADIAAIVTGVSGAALLFYAGRGIVRGVKSLASDPVQPQSTGPMTDEDVDEDLKKAMDAMS
jgi:hypothetical protein